MIICEPGDILLYGRAPNLDTRLILKGERMEDPGEDKYFYHVAIALDANWKIEAQGKTVAITEIDYERCTVFRPPIPEWRVKLGLAAVMRCEGQKYDWLAIVNDGLSYLTHGLVHLPDTWIASVEHKRKICSSLVALYFKSAQWGPKFGWRVSPEDIYDAVQDWPVTGQAAG
ncbi:hypothetical protein ACOALA_13405 [Alicyclobacillus acidoterrestris]|uniref:hypothetical protein n=1 Tax=Alicyclobacillus acidoterrestris TaxID=1450 RepID=UPI003F530008